MTPITDELDEARTFAWQENSAQAIFNAIKEFENYRSQHERRWVWELFQNAIDASRPTQNVNVSLLLQGTSLTFKHDGRPFTPSEIAHLIYHGTTKTPEDENVGRFGTGFLTAHLMSKQVEVASCLADGRGFAFTLDRGGKSAEEVRIKMEQAWKDFRASLKQGNEGANGWTSYTYQLGPSRSTAQRGLEDLEKVVPYVLAFAGKLGSVQLDREDGTVVWQKTSEEVVDEEQNTYLIIVRRRSQESSKEIIVAATGDKEVSVAVLLEERGGLRVVVPPKDIPQIFFVFPLWDTHDLFPAVMNSRFFCPTNERSGLCLGVEGTEDNQKNKALIVRACSLFTNLVQHGVREQWRDLHCLGRLGLPPEKDWLKDNKWLQEQYQGVIRSLLGSELVDPVKGARIAVEEARIPVAVDEPKEGVFYELASGLEPEKVPMCNVYDAWAEIITMWAAVMDRPVDEMDQALTLHKLAAEVSSIGSLGCLQDRLGKDQTHTLEWLTSLLELICESGQQRILDEAKLLPNQRGEFQPRAGLYVDVGVDEQLKDVADSLSSPISRLNLLHSQIGLESILSLLPKKTENECLMSALAKLKEKATRKEIDQAFLICAPKMFSWLVRKEKWSLLGDNFPFIFHGQAQDVALLSRANPVLGPVERWHEVARPFADIFPKANILGDCYMLSEPVWRLEQSDWGRLVSEGLLLSGILHTEEDELSEQEIGDLLSEGKLPEDKGHKARVMVAKIAFLDEKDKGLLDAARRSKERARRLLAFLMTYVLPESAEWRTPIKVDCSCGEHHKVYPAQWLTKVKRREWVPVGRNQDLPPSVENLAKLIEEDKELQSRLKDENCSQFLNRLGIGVADLMKNILIKDAQEKQRVDDALARILFGIRDARLMGLVADFIESHPDFVAKAQSHAELRERIQRNQELGRRVEDLVREVLKEKFGVKPHFKGYDIELYENGQCDPESDIGEVWIEVPDVEPLAIIEVKATTTDEARMTRSQARQAVDRGGQYVLCVVDLKGLGPDDVTSKEQVRTSLRMIENIGPLLKPHYEAISVQQGAPSGTDIYVDVADERYVILRGLWQRMGKDFDGWVVRLDHLLGHES
jgi:hypothetical protein